MATEDPLRIDRDLAIYLDGGVAIFRPAHGDAEKVLQSVLRWEQENEDHPRRVFVEEWIQSFELPERQLESLAAGYNGAGGSMNDQTLLRAWAITRRDVIAGSVWLGAATAAHGWEAALPVVGLDHVNIRTPDVRRTAEFYAKLFGTQVSRAENAFASAGSRRGELWFVRLGQSSLAISPGAPGEKRESTISVSESKGSIGMR